MAKSEAEVALEIYQSVEQANEKQRKLKSSTFWSRFGVRARQKKVVERIEHLLSEQRLKVAVKSGKQFGEEDDDDWIVLTLTLPPKGKILPLPPVIPTDLPDLDWFQEIQTRQFESEREVETYFILPILEKLGYNYNDTAIGYPVEMFKGVQRTKTEADFVLFNGPTREKMDVLLIIEAKNNDKGITVDHIGQAKSYAHELLPACYIITNGQEIKIFQFNGMLVPDELVMDLDRSLLSDAWAELYGYVSKEATIRRKSWMKDVTKEIGPSNEAGQSGLG